MQLTIVIPTYNRSALLLEALGSVLAQPFTDYEIVVVDDGSSDDTPAVIERLVAAHTHVRYHRQANAGPGAARNTGIQLAAGEYIAFLDSDDLWFPWTLQTIADAIAQSGRAPVLQSSMVWIDSPADMARTQLAPVRIQGWPTLWDADCPIAGAGNTIVQTDLLRRVGGFPTARIVGEDLDLMYRMGAERFVLIEAPICFAYRRHGNMTTGSARQWYDGGRFILGQLRAGRYSADGTNAARIRHTIARDVSYRAEQCLLRGGRGLALDLYCRSATLCARTAQLKPLLQMPAKIGLHAIGLWPRRRGTS